MSKIDFSAIKASVTMQQVMGLLQITVTKWASSDQARCRCPCGAGDSHDLSISTTKNSFQCFGSKPKASGDIITFVAHVKSIGLRDAAKFLQEHFMSKPIVAKPTPKIANDNGASDFDYGDALEAFIARLE
jgi:DNA primase